MKLLNFNSSDASLESGLVFCFPDFIEKTSHGWLFCLFYIFIVALAIVFGFYIKVRKGQRAEQKGLSDDQQYTTRQSRNFTDILRVLPERHASTKV
jgi:cbb3-type cytochrome oxidase subunit 3